MNNGQDSGTNSVNKQPEGQTIWLEVFKWFKTNFLMCSKKILPQQTHLVASGGFMMLSPDVESSSSSSSSSPYIYLPGQTQFNYKEHEISILADIPRKNFTFFKSQMQLESILIQNQVFASEDVLKRDLSEAVQKKCYSLQFGTFVGTFFMSQPWVENHCHLTSMLQTNSCCGVFFVSVITKCQLEAKYQEDEAPSTYWTS